MTVDVVSVICGPSRPELPNCKVTLFDNSDNTKSPCQCYQEILEASTADVIVYVHSDLTIHDQDWLKKILKPFDDEDVVAVGLGGATSLGRPGLYKQPYRIENMARGGYASNQTDWQVHGSHLDERFIEVAVLDAFLLAVRRDFLTSDSVGGWPVDHLSHHCLDLWLACVCVREGKKTVAIGVSCTHHGGGASTADIYKRAKWLQGGSLEEDHRQPHKWLYNEYRDVLPIAVSPQSVITTRTPRNYENVMITGLAIPGPDHPDEDEAKDKEKIHEEKQAEVKSCGKVNIVMVTNCSRPKLLSQALDSLFNTTAPQSYTLTIVRDGHLPWSTTFNPDWEVVTVDCHVLSRLKNLGVYWSEQQFGRGDWLCIADDDVAFLPRWLERMTFVYGQSLGLLGGVRHPYHGVNERIGSVQVTDAVAGYCHFMSWEAWDKFGPYEGNAEGIGQSEDFAFSRKFVDAGYKVGYINPPAIAHCGITNSQGQPAIGSGGFERIPGVIYE